MPASIPAPADLFRLDASCQRQIGAVIAKTGLVSAVRHAAKASPPVFKRESTGDGALKSSSNPIKARYHCELHALSTKDSVYRAPVAPKQASIRSESDRMRCR